MCDIGDLSDLWFEEMIGTDLDDTLDDHVSFHRKDGGLYGGSRRRSSASTLMMDDEVSYTHITLINGERICLKEEFKNEELQDCGDNEDVCSSQDMDLNSVLQAGVLERVAAPISSSTPVSSTCNLSDLDFNHHWEIMSVEPIVKQEKISSISSQNIKIEPSQSIVSTTTFTPAASLAAVQQHTQLHPSAAAARVGLVKSVGTAVTVKPRTTILASQLPQPILASRLLDTSTGKPFHVTGKPVTSTLLTRPQLSTVVISAGDIVSSDANSTNNNTKTSNNNNSLLRTALIGKPMLSSLSQHSLVSASSSSASFGSGSVVASSSTSPLLTSSSYTLSAVTNTITPITSTMATAIGATQLSKAAGLRKAVLTMVGNSGESKAEDIYLLSLEGRDAIAHLKNGASGASQMFPNTRVTSDPADLVTSPSIPTLTSVPASSVTGGTSSLISIEVDMDGNLVLHKSNLVNQNNTVGSVSGVLPNNITTIKAIDDGSSMDTSTMLSSVGSNPNSSVNHHLSSKLKKFHRRPIRESLVTESVSSNIVSVSTGGSLTGIVGNSSTSSTNSTSSSSGERNMKKESRLLHYCPVCNKGFKDKYSVNVHVRTHTGEKPFACQVCSKKFRQKAHLAKHQQTHTAKPGDNNKPGGGQSIGSPLPGVLQSAGSPLPGSPLSSGILQLGGADLEAMDTQSLNSDIF